MSTSKPLSPGKFRELSAELASVERTLQRIACELFPLGSLDERVERAESTVAAVKRLQWALNTGQGEPPLLGHTEVILDVKHDGRP
jgi:hypothetical protein